MGRNSVDLLWAWNESAQRAAEGILKDLVIWQSLCVKVL